MPRPPAKPRLAVRSATVAKYLPDAEAPADPNAPIAPSSLLTDQYILNAERSASCALFRLTLLSLLLYFVAGAAVFTYLEDDWSPPEALWFLAQTLSTVGYGDIVPATKVGKLAASVWSLAGVAFTVSSRVVARRSVAARAAIGTPPLSHAPPSGHDSRRHRRLDGTRAGRPFGGPAGRRAPPAPVHRARLLHVRVLGVRDPRRLGLLHGARGQAPRHGRRRVPGRDHAVHRRVRAALLVLLY